MILTYWHEPAALYEHDPRTAEVAAEVGRMIREREAALRVEHVGSTSVRGCPGKGVVDLMLVYPVGMLERARDVLDEMGFQRQSTRDPFPESRPMRLGALESAGARFRMHVHVLSEDSPEVGEMRWFRDRLRADPALVAAYGARKREILAAGITDTVDYSYAKGGFIREQLSSGGFPLRD